MAAPDSELDYAEAKLAFDALIDPAIDVEATRAEIERLAAAARVLAGPSANATHKVAAVRTVIYKPGPWNNNRPFAYDHSDPYGQNIRNKLLSTYIETRRGNCISMPFLFIIVADKLGVDVRASTAPLHVFVKYADEQGRFVNLETTSGAHPARDAWYQQNTPMSEQAIANGVYLKTLSKRETIEQMATQVIDQLMEQADYLEVIEVADVMLEAWPNDAYALVKKGTAYGHLLRTRFDERYPTREDKRYAEHNHLARRNLELFAKAEALGWRESDGQLPSTGQP